LPRRSSTADTSFDRIHRRSPWGAWGRADLRGAADRPIDLPHPCREAGRSVLAASPGKARCQPDASDRARV
jgi:hypothetical protein